MAMTMTFEDLKKKTVAELRDMAKSLTHDAVQGYTQMNKEHLLPALCNALGIEHAHHRVRSGLRQIKDQGTDENVARRTEQSARGSRLREAEGDSHRAAYPQSPHSRPRGLVRRRRHDCAEDVLQPALHLIAQPTLDRGAGVDGDAGRRQRAADDGW
jgi:hypothetical protein